MNRKLYASDLTDEQWDILFPLLPSAKPGGRPRTVDLREVVNDILSQSVKTTEKGGLGAMMLARKSPDESGISL